jgi:hypothetical protein
MQQHIKQKKTFQSMWYEIIKPLLKYTFDSMDVEFRKMTGAQIRDEEDLKPYVEKEFKTLRHQLKIECYGEGKKELHLDSRKLGAILCASLLNVKCIEFDETKAVSLSETVKNKISQKEFNKWSVDNTLVNYKIAYLASLDLVYISLIYCLLNNNDMLVEELNETQRKGYAYKLIKQGRLCNYPLWQNFNSFAVNMIISLARADVFNREFDMQLYSLQLWQLEMYTLKSVSLQ